MTMDAGRVLIYLREHPRSPDRRVWLIAASLGRDSKLAEDRAYVNELLDRMARAGAVRFQYVDGMGTICEPCAA
jgi:hypothetical protein